MEIIKITKNQNEFKCLKIYLNENGTSQKP